jgi:hypothetical protein
MDVKRFRILLDIIEALVDALAERRTIDARGIRKIIRAAKDQMME